MNWAGVLGTPVKPLESGTPKVMDLPAFDGYGDPKKLDVISRIAEQAGRDPQLATVAVNIFRQAGVAPRDYRGQAAAILKWVQQNIYYVNEPDERLQDPFYTLKVKYGDCDDMAILVYALARSVRLPARLVISGVTKSGKKVRYRQGDRNFDRTVDWSHIYLMIGDRPYGQPQWSYAEPTLNVPLGWDVVSHEGDILPEMVNSSPSYGNSMDPFITSGTYTGRRFTSTTVPSTSTLTRPSFSPPTSSTYAPSVSPLLSMDSGTFAPSGSGSSTTPFVSDSTFSPSGSGSSTLPSVDSGIYTPSGSSDSSGSGSSPFMLSTPGANLSTYAAKAAAVSSESTSTTTSDGTVVPRGQHADTPGFQMGGEADGAANAVAVLLVDRGGQILLLHRSPDQAFMGGSWDLPGAKVSPSRSARDQAVRILAAETGVQLPAAALRPLVTAYHPTSGTSVFFVAQVPGEAARAVRVAAPEHIEFRWVGPEEGRADMMLVPYMPLVLDALRKARSGSTGYGAPMLGGSGGGYGLAALALAGIVGYVLAKQSR